MNKRDLTPQEREQALTRFGDNGVKIKAHGSGYYVQGQSSRSEKSYKSIDEIPKTVYKAVK